MVLTAVIVCGIHGMYATSRRTYLGRLTYLEGPGDLVNALRMGNTRVTVWVIGFNLVTKSS